jgi:hypothetical protein
MVVSEPPPVEKALADREYVVSAARGYDGNVADPGEGGLVDRLIAALRETESGIAIASPFARGGRLRDPSWIARTATYWQNTFLSLAAHGEVATVIGTVRVLQRDALQRVLPSCAGVDLDSEIVLEARRQGVRIIEVPADLARKPDPGRFTLQGLLASSARLWARLRVGLHYRPALWLALPGLVPGLLPIVVALLLILRATPAQAAFWTIVTLVIQYGSLALFSWQTSAFVAKRWVRRGPP